MALSNIRRGMSRKGPTLEGEREHFEKNQTISIQKAISPNEAAAKEKHIRSAILGTYQEKGAHTFWHVVRRLPLSSNSVICWKFCHVLHKLLRDGHSNTLNHSSRFKPQLKDLSRIWGQGALGYGRLISTYMKLLLQRMKFHTKYTDFPGNLLVDEETLDKIANNDVNALFELSVDFFDYLDALMDLQLMIFSTIDTSRSVSTTDSGQCRLAPCIPVILDSSQLYDYIVKILFKLHTCLPADTLTGHRDRFLDNYKKLKKFYYVCSNMQYFKMLIQVPLMPDSPPNFLLSSDGSHELGPVRMIEEEAPRERTPSPEPEPVVDNLIDTNFTEVFGDSMGSFQFEQTNGTDPKDDLIAELRAEIERLREEIERMKKEHMGEIRSLLDRLMELERELAESAEQKREMEKQNEAITKKLRESETKLRNAARAHTQLQDFEKRSSAVEEMYKKLKDKHMQLVKDHAGLLRQNADTKKQADQLQQNAGESESQKARLLREADELKQQMKMREEEEEERKRKEAEERFKLLVCTVEEVEQMVKDAIEFMDNPINSQSTCNADTLICTTQNADTSLSRVDTSLTEYVDTDDVSKLLQSLSSFGHNISQTIINGSATCHMAPDDQQSVIGSPTPRTTRTFELVMGLDETCRSCGSDTLDFLSKLKMIRSLDGSKESVTSQQLHDRLAQLLQTAQDLLPKMLDVGGDLHDMVEQEMASTSAAIEQAAERIESLLREARERDSGLNLEVNERILDSCTNLMQMIRILIQSSKELQREIADNGRGASSAKDFYMKNSRWTEGLISAAKAVGWGATVLTDAADHVVQGDGKFEELIVCSHEIAASTAQLVAASRVKANKTSGRLSTLQTASKNVNGATANVVATTKSARQQMEDSGESMEQLASAMTLTQIKMKEMDSQVKLLELEQALKDERLKLGALRRKHYELAEAQENENEENENNSNNKEVENKPPLKPKPALPAKPMLQ